jgi:hypothetical protein
MKRAIFEEGVSLNQEKRHALLTETQQDDYNLSCLLMSGVLCSCSAEDELRKCRQRVKPQPPHASAWKKKMT